MQSSRRPVAPSPWILRCDASALPADAALVDSLARLALVGRRHRCELRLCAPTPELWELIAFMGLDEVLGRED